MHVLHGAWVPETTAAFIQRGELFVWVETAELHSPRGRHETPMHPRHLGQDELAAFLRETLGLKEAVAGIKLKPSTCSLLLPSGDEGPWPSPEISRWSGEEPPQGAAALDAAAMHRASSFATLPIPAAKRLDRSVAILASFCQYARQMYPLLHSNPIG